MNNTDLQERFLKMVRQGPGYMARLSKEKGWTQEWCEDHQQMLYFADQHKDSHNVYFSLASFSSGQNTRETKFAEHLCSFWADVDRHENSSYKTDEEIEQAIENFLEKTGLPRPSIWHYSGYGLHIYWPLLEELSRDEWQPIADQLQALLQTLKVGADPITANPAQVLRLPGTLNFRNPDMPVATRLEITNSELIPVDEFADKVAQATKLFPALVKPASTKPIVNGIPYTSENVSKVKAMLAVIDPDPDDEGSGNRHRWMEIVWGIASTGWGDAAYEIARQWSESGDLFDEDDFDGVWNSYDPSWQAGEKRGIGFGTLVHYAKAAGYSNSLPESAWETPTARETFCRPGKLIPRPASDYEPMPVEWLVEDSIPLGAMVVIAGEPGLGKSQIAIRLAAAITTGHGLPDHKKFSDIGSVIILANEDDAERTIRPRLEAAEADLTKVHIVEGVAREGSEVDFFQLDRDTAELQQRAAEIGDVRLIIIDPPGAYLGAQVDSYKDTDVRRVLAPLAKLAQDTGALLLLVVHLNKRSDGSPQQRISGSTAWTAAPRAAFLAIEHKPTRKRYLVPVKNNLGDDKKGYEYQILERCIKCQHVQLKSSYIDWVGTSNLTASELLCPPRTKIGSAVDDAKQLLEDELGSGSRAVEDLKASARAAGISWAAVQRAKRDLGVISKKVNDAWQWNLVFGGKHAGLD